MARWEPDARGRLLRAALDLFVEQGYDGTTAAQIAERAGLTKTTLFRLFADKREVLFQGQPASVALVLDSMASCAQDTNPADAVRAGLDALCSAHGPEQKEIGRRIEMLVEGSAELRERATYKRAGIGAAFEKALHDRTDDPRLAGVLADLGVRAYYQGFSTWIGTRNDDALDVIVRGELDKLLAVLPVDG